MRLTNNRSARPLLAFGLVQVRTTRAVAVEPGLEVLDRLQRNQADAEGSSLTLYQTGGETMSPPVVCAVTTYPPVVAFVTQRTAVPGRLVVVVPPGRTP